MEISQGGKRAHCFLQLIRDILKVLINHNSNSLGTLSLEGFATNIDTQETVNILLNSRTQW